MSAFIFYYNFFGAALSFKTNSQKCAEEFEKIYGYFKSGDKNAAISCSIEKDNSSYRIKAMCRRYNLDYTIHEEPHPDVYLSLFSPVIYSVKNYFLIHAGSLSTPGAKSLIISAPCGFGKTTNTRELLKQGFKLLSDELAPISLKTGLIYPYPRGMGVLNAAKKDIIEIPKDIIGPASKPAFVIFLTLEKVPEEKEKRYIELYVGRITDDLINAFKKVTGVKEITPVFDRLFPMLRFLLDEDAYITARMQEICNYYNIPILYTLKGKTHKPDFNAAPKLREIPQEEGILELSRNILNAHNSALLEETFSGSRPRMLFELAGLTENARFFALTVGKLSEMTRMIKELCTTNKL